MKTFFDVTEVNSTRVRNRFVVAPMTRVSADLRGVPSREMLDYYAAFSTGGFGAIITEGLYTDSLYAKGYPTQPGIISQPQVNGWREIVSSVKENNTLFIAQLMHAGSISQAIKKTKAPSQVLPLGNKLAAYGGGSGPFPVSEAMTLNDIKSVIDGYVNSSRNAMDAGFHGVELHAANGYLLDQFLTPYLNQRTDDYGGSVENRFRIIHEIIDEIRKVVPANFIIGIRISEGKVNNLHYRWPGGSQVAREMLAEIAKMQIDYLHVAAEHWGWEAECVYKDGTSLTGLAKELLNCPVIANGKLDNLTLSQRLLDSNQADLFAIGKAALANPDFVNKLVENREPMRFDSNTLFPNPSLFANEKYETFLQEYEMNLEEKICC